MRIQWSEISRYVSLGYLEWQMLLGQSVINKKYGPGVISEVVNEREFYVNFRDRNRGPFSFYLSLDYFESLKPSDELAHRILLFSLSKAAVGKTIECIVEHPKLTDIDVRVALTWGNYSHLARDKESLTTLISQGSRRQSEDIGRLLSARAAELAVTAFYRNYGFTVEDISVQQATNRKSSDWKTYDLKINNYPVDVKNCRRSEQNENIYVEHWISKFKYNPQGNKVALVGVLSPYLSPYCIIEPQTSLYSISPLILGVTRWDRLVALKIFEKSGVLQIDLGSSASFLPPWVFEFGSIFYKMRDELIACIQQIDMPAYDVWKYLHTEMLASSGVDQSIAPMLIASGISLTNYWDQKTFRAWELDFIQRIHSWRNQVGLSLPYLYCTVLTHFLETVTSDHAPETYSPKKYRRLLFFDSCSLNMPLFIFDPLRTIDALITTLTTLWHSRRDIVSKFRIFKLQGLNILKGKALEDEHQWKTLVAYCGGWQEDGVKCGFSPLVLGDFVDGKRVESCPKCGKLICPKCGFCYSLCEIKYHPLVR